MIRLVRNMKTEVVHLPGCKRRGADCRPWTYAATSTMAEITADTVAYPWLHLCRACLPGACACGKCSRS